MKVSYFKFADKRLGYGHTVRDMTKEELESEFKYLNRFLDFDYIGGTGGCHDFWNDGYYRYAGYQFFIEDGCKILVNDGGRGWYSRHSPSRDPNLIEKYISAYDPETSEWMYADDVHYREWGG